MLEMTDLPDLRKRVNGMSLYFPLYIIKTSWPAQHGGHADQHNLPRHMKGAKRLRLRLHGESLALMYLLRPITGHAYDSNHTFEIAKQSCGRLILDGRHGPAINLESATYERA